jgi:hypothetical protein
MATAVLILARSARRMLSLTWTGEAGKAEAAVCDLIIAKDT